MGPLVVVALHPGVEGLLRLFQAGERPRWLEQLPPQGLVEPLHLAGGGGLRTAVSRWVMPFSRQMRSNSTSAGRGSGEPAGELLAVAFLTVVKVAGWVQAGRWDGRHRGALSDSLLVRSSHPRWRLRALLTARRAARISGGIW
jgi:hypothetical protein